jgi:hypothetical protein
MVLQLERLCSHKCWVKKCWTREERLGEVSTAHLLRPGGSKVLASSAEQSGVLLSSASGPTPLIVRLSFTSIFALDVIWTSLCFQGIRSSRQLRNAIALPSRFTAKEARP